MTTKNNPTTRVYILNNLVDRNPNISYDDFVKEKEGIATNIRYREEENTTCYILASIHERVCDDISKVHNENHSLRNELKRLNRIIDKLVEKR